jgi:peroxiredoxin (alkyl hydroperoxide reductase subunit C)
VSQEAPITIVSLVGKKFPSIAVDAISEMGDNMKINIFEEAVNNNKKVLLFWYPKDFTFVCPTELHAFQAALPEFTSKNTIVIGASCDTNEVHFAWLNTAKNNGGIELHVGGKFHFTVHDLGVFAGHKGKLRSVC